MIKLLVDNTIEGAADEGERKVVLKKREQIKRKKGR